MRVDTLTLTSAIFAASAITQNSSTTCYDYVLVDIRGTGEVQGPSVGFINATRQTRSAVSNGAEYDVVYPAADDQQNSAGVTDAQRYINEGLQNCPNQVYALLGYSQGASTVKGALSNYTDANSAFYKAVKAVLVIGNPYHVPNKTSNVDQFGGNMTRPYPGVSYSTTTTNITDSLLGPGIPDIYYSSGKVLDICYTGDVICAPGYPNASFLNHLGYITDANVQNMGAKFLISKLSGTNSTGPGSNSTSGTNGTTTTTSGSGSGPTSGTGTGSGTGTDTGSGTTSPSPSRTGGAAATARVSNVVFAVVLGLAAAIVM